MICRQLEKAEARETYKNVVIDTLNEAWDLCTEFICAQNSVQKIKEIPYGQGYKDRDNEFASTLRKIMNLGYGLIVTCHTKVTVIDSKDDIDINAIAPDLDKRCTPIINGLVDIMGMITKTWNQEKQTWDRWLLTKATPTVSAGSRIKYLPEKIPFGYKYLEEAVSFAISEAQKHGAKIINEPISRQETDKLDYNALMSEASRLWSKIVNVEGKSEEEKQELARRVLKRVEMIFGHPTKISEINEDQVDLLSLVVLDMKDLAEES